VYRALDGARSFDEWRGAAEEHDALTGAMAWRDDDYSEHYDASDLRRSVEMMQRMRAQGQAEALADSLHQDVARHLNDLSASELYDTALSGIKVLHERYLSEVETSLVWLAREPIGGVDRASKRRRFEAAYKVFGRSALMLSGGATWGFFHLGVVKALFELDLLPHILSGASTGAMGAAGVCGRNNVELEEMYADTRQIRLDGLLPVGVRGSLRTGAWLDPERLFEVLRHNVGDNTFAEAFAHSGRSLNISVSPTRTRQKPRLLCHLTSPDVLVARAALASSALPGLFPPITLQCRRRGQVSDYIGSERWVDGSLYGDLPKLRLARLHNVNHFIVSQTNPHVLPFVRHHGRRGLRPTVAGLATATMRTQGTFAADLARRVTRKATGPLPNIADQAYALVSQDYRGDIDIHPQLNLRLFSKVVSNPSREDLAAFIAEGERSVWPKVAMIRNQTRLGKTFRRCLQMLSDPQAHAADRA